jgi:hypothetical protein
MSTPLLYPTSKNAVQKTLDAQLLAGVTASVTLNNVVGIQNKAGVFVVDRVDANGTPTPNKREYIKFTGVSGSTLTTLTRNADGGGTDQDHAVGAIVEFVSDILQEQAIIDGLLNVITTAGALDTTKVIDLTTAQTLTNKTLTAPVINGAITGDAISTGATINTGTANDEIVTPKAIADSKVSIIDKTETLTNKTLTTPKINEDVALTATSTQLNAVATGGVTTRLLSKTITGSRDLTAAGAPTDVSYTGVGFQPTSIIAMCTVNGGTTGYFTITVADSAKATNGLYRFATTDLSYQNNLIYVGTASGTNQYATLKSYDADGFTLTWTKTGSPTGTLTMVFLCFR